MCVDGECVRDCSGSCDSENPCLSGCCCGTVWNFGNPGSLVSGCRPSGYACCCDYYKKLCYVDMSECIVQERSGGFPPNIAGSPPGNAIVVINGSAVYTDVNGTIGGIWSYVDGEDAACYNYGYYTVADDCESCDGTCTDWFDTGAFSSGFWQTFCDGATINNVNACDENPAP